MDNTKPTEVVMTPDEVKGLVNDATSKAVADIDALVEKKAEEIAEKKFKSFGNPFNIAMKSAERDEEPKPTMVLGKLLKLTNEAKGNNLSSFRDIVSYVNGKQAKTALDDMVVKVLTASSLADGGYMLPPDYVDTLIPYLYKNTILEKLGVYTYTTNKGGFTVPKQTGTVTFSWSGETTQPTESSPTYGNISLNLRECKAITAISNKLIAGTDGQAMRWVEDALPLALGNELDRVFLYGNGSTEPLGIRNQVATANRFDANSTVNLANVTDDLMKAKQYVEANMHNVDGGSYIMSSRSKNKLWAMRNSLGVQEFSQDINNGVLLGAGLITSNTVVNTCATSSGVPATTGGALSEVYYVDPTRIIVGRSAGAEMVISTEGGYYNGSATVNAFDHDLTLIRLNTQMDVKVMYDTALSIIDEVNWV